MCVCRQTEVGLVGEDQQPAAVPQTGAAQRARTARHRQCHPEGRVFREKGTDARRVSRNSTKTARSRGPFNLTFQHPKPFLHSTDSTLMAFTADL